MAPLPDNGLTSDNHSEFLVLSDLHLDMGCWRKDGTLDVDGGVHPGNWYMRVRLIKE